MIEWSSWLVGLALLIGTLPGTLELLLISLGALIPGRPARAISPARREVSMAVIIPVYNEETGLARTVRSLMACDDPLPAAGLVVQACNCTDRSVEIARALGCTVIERIDPLRRGKGHGLDHAFRHLAPYGHTAYLIVDADTVVERNFLNEFRHLFSRGAAAGQCVLRVANPGVNVRTRVINVAFLAFTFLRPLARHRLGLSVGLFGNGFGLRASTVRDVPYECFSIAEDLEYHARLVRAGKVVELVPGTSVRADMCTTGSQARLQRERWEGGRLRVMIEEAPALACDALLRGRLRLLEPLLDLLLLPLAYHVLLLGLMVLVATGPLLVYACAGLTLVAAHVAQAMILGRAGADDWKALAGAPFYMAWKLIGLGGILKAAGKRTPWRRTERNRSPP